MISMSFMRSVLVVAGIALACASCDSIPTTGAAPADTIHVGQPEVFENADLQAQLDGLRQQLVALNVMDQPSLVSALSNLQGASATQSGASLQVLQRGLPQVTNTTGTTGSTATGTNPGTTTGSSASTTTTGASLAPGVPTSAVPAAPTLPTVALGSVGVLEQELQLSSQVLGYELLLTGSDFARYTTHGGTKDKLVIGFPITLNPGSEDRNQAAEVEIKYYPPNPGQYKEPVEFKSPKAGDPTPRNVCDSNYFRDENARVACLKQEASPTIVNILPTERSYNTVVLSSSAATFGLGALIGTVSVGGSYGFGKQTQYLVAQQDTLALQKDSPAQCGNTEHRKREPDSDVTANAPLACDPDSQGVSFIWQFRPVLGQHFVRAGLRRTYVQLAIPYASRPYPYYGGIVEIRTRWRPFDSKKGVVTDSPAQFNDTVSTRAVFGHPFSSPVLSDVSVHDLGSGNLLVQVNGNYLIGASVLVGSTLLNSSSPGFVASYNALQFTTTAQALAQTGASVVGSGGVVTPIQAVSLCKYQDELGECYRKPEDSRASGFQVERLEVVPVSDSSSLVRVELNRPLDIGQYAYEHYYRDDKGNVVGGSDERKPGEPSSQAISFADLNRLVVVTAGGRTYGFSDQPFQEVRKEDSGNAVLSFVAGNDSLNAAPQLTVQRLFGDPESDSLPVGFIPPGRLQLTPFNHDEVSQAAAPKGDAKPKPDQSQKRGPGQKQDQSNNKDPKGAALQDAKKPSPPQTTQTHCYKAQKMCEYLLVGAMADEALLYSIGPPCTGRISMSAPGAFGLNARRVQIPDCYKQLTLELPASESGRTVSEVIALSITAPPSTASSNSVTKTVVKTPNTPNFTLTRSARDVDESQNVVYISVGIQKLKDQSATLTVSNADVISAVAGSGAQLNVQAGNQVTVTQDTNVTFQLRNAAPTSVNVVAEGKTSGVSTGKVTFDGEFHITHREPAKPSK